MAAILAHPEVKPLLSDAHFPVDGTLIKAILKARASMKSFQPKAPPEEDDPGDPPTDAPPQARPASPSGDPADAKQIPQCRSRLQRGETIRQNRSDKTHASVTDPDALLYKKSPGAGAIPCFIGQTLMENRNGLIVQADLTHADGYGDRKAALDMIHRHSQGSTRQLTLGADRRISLHAR